MRPYPIPIPIPVRPYPMRPNIEIWIFVRINHHTPVHMIGHNLPIHRNQFPVEFQQIVSIYPPRFAQTNSIAFHPQQFARIGIGVDKYTR